MSMMWRAGRTLAGTSTCRSQRAMFVCKHIINNNQRSMFTRSIVRSIQQPTIEAIKLDQTSVIQSKQPINKSHNESSDSSSELHGDDGVSRWLFGIAGLVFGMVAIGGLTRLTKSGLSMVEWKPHQGLPPLNEAEWLDEFIKYQQYPEYALTNSSMTLQEFKFIYMMEFSHRQLGRIVGIAFAVPFAYFAYKRRVTAPLMKRLSLLLIAGGLQGGIGWWMVKSGLDSPHRPEHSAHVHVSPYRLATHLLSAFIIYAVLLDTALLVRKPITTQQAALFNSIPALAKIKSVSKVTAAVIAITIASGAFVAGNEAGLVYGEWPLMGGRFIPEDLTSPFIQPKWKNIFEHSTLVQFDHRMLAYATWTACLGVMLYARRFPGLPLPVRVGSQLVFAMATLQASLGITTLINNVPVSLASLHQCGSLLLLTCIIVLVRRCGGPVPRSLSAQASKLLKQNNVTFVSTTSKPLV